VDALRARSGARVRGGPASPGDLRSLTVADELERRDDPDGRLEALEALARLGAGTWLRTARWYAGTSLRSAFRAAPVVRHLKQPYLPSGANLADLLR